jgi:uncharacterized protein
MRIIVIILILGYFSAQGQTISLCNLEYKDSIYYKDNVPYSGTVASYYSSGKIASSGQLKDGLPDSVFLEYKRNGKLSVVSGYNGGKRTYLFRYSTLMGNNLTIEQPSFPYYEFYRHKSLKKQGYYVDGKEQGIWRYYYKNGNIKEEVEYNKGEIVNPYYEWDKNGNKTSVDTGFSTRKTGKLRVTKYGTTRTEIN